MNKLMTMAAVALALGAGSAGAQNVEFDNGVYTIQGCYTASGGVRCDYLFTPNDNYTGYFAREWFQVVTVDGATVSASQLAAAGSKLADVQAVERINFFKGAPVKISALFPVSQMTTSFRVVGVAGKGMNNIAVRGATAPAPVAAPVQTINLAGNWNATLTNCKAAANNTVVCTATLKK